MYLIIYETFNVKVMFIIPRINTGLAQNSWSSLTNQVEKTQVYMFITPQYQDNGINTGNKVYYYIFTTLFLL